MVGILATGAGVGLATTSRLPSMTTAMSWAVILLASLAAGGLMWANTPSATPVEMHIKKL